MQSGTNEITQPLPRAQASPVSWFEFAKLHRASLASLVVLVFPLVMPFTALAANILIYGLFALGFNLVYGYLGLLCCRSGTPLCSEPAPTSAASRSCTWGCRGMRRSRSVLSAAC